MADLMPSNFGIVDDKHHHMRFFLPSSVKAVDEAENYHCRLFFQVIVFAARFRLSRRTRVSHSYDIGSLRKQFIAAAVLLIVERGAFLFPTQMP